MAKSSMIASTIPKSPINHGYKDASLFLPFVLINIVLSAYNKKGNWP